jgi:hypothetical protein
MKHLSYAIMLLLLAAMGLVGCDKSIEPKLDQASMGTLEPDLAALQAASWPRQSMPAPSPLVTVAVGEQSLEFWPYTAADYSGTPKDPINLIFIGKADPLDIRAALLALDGDRSALGMPPMPPFNSVWEDDIEGDVQSTYASNCDWTPGAIQLICGDYSQIRFHLRLFKAGAWTLGGVHFEVLIPGTTTHQILSWELAEQFVMGDIMRTGLLDQDVPMIPTDQINESPYQAIPAIVYNGLPPELRGLIGGPLGDVSEDVPIANDGHSVILNLASRIQAAPTVTNKEYVVQFDQVVPKPFCSLEPSGYVYVYGPITITEMIEFSAGGNYQATFHAKGELSVTPVNPVTGEPLAEPYTARVWETHNSVFNKGVASGASLRYQALTPFSVPGSGWFFERFRVSSNGGNGYQLITRCEPTQMISPALVGGSGEVDVEGDSETVSVVSFR